MSDPSPDPLDRHRWSGGPLRTLLAVCILFSSFGAGANGSDARAVVTHYADLAHAVFGDSLATAERLQAAVEALIATPSEATLAAAREAWLAARVPYGQSEALRFGNPNVDEWEGGVNAWPLDEGLIDYVDPGYQHEAANAFATANVIAGEQAITVDLLRDLQEKGGSEANVASGYHAIEFLLWGQDLNPTPQSAGQRPWTDFATGDACTHGHCERRAGYLRVATRLLVEDLAAMVADWAPDHADNYRAALLAEAPAEALRRMWFGLGSLSLGELAGERIRVALLAHSQEDEHSCFSDNTHADIAMNAQGIRNLYEGRYTRVDGSTLAGPSLAALVARRDAALADALSAALATTGTRTDAVVAAAAAGEPFDRQIAAGNEAGNARVEAVVQALRAQTVLIEQAAAATGVAGLQPESSDAL